MSLGNSLSISRSNAKHFMISMPVGSWTTHRMPSRHSEHADRHCSAIKALYGAVRKNPHGGSVRLAKEIIEIPVAADFDKEDILSDLIDRIGAHIARIRRDIGPRLLALAPGNIGLDGLYVQIDGAGWNALCQVTTLPLRS